MRTVTTFILTLCIAFIFVGYGDGMGQEGGDPQKPSTSGPYAKEGFATQIEDGRLWVFRPDKLEKSDKHVTYIAAGPEGMTLRSPDKETALAYLAAKSGFQTEIVDGRIWVWNKHDEKKFSDKHSTLIGAGPMGMTVKALDKDTALFYLSAKPGFITQVEDGRLWVFKQGSDMKKSDKHATLIGAGPAGMTIKALDKDTAIQYVAHKEGFVTMVEDGRLWVFREGVETKLSDKHVTRIGAGPMKMTVKALDKDTLLAYLR